MDQTAKASNALMVGFQLSFREWPLWLGYAGLNYIQNMLIDAIGPQGQLATAVAQGFLDTNRQDYYYAYKFPAQAADEVKMK